MSTRKRDYSRLVFQFLIALLGVEPLVWRRIQVPGGYSFWDLHVAIQDAMGWQDCHLHEFQLHDPESSDQVRIGIPDEGDPYGAVTLPDHEIPISSYFSYYNIAALYSYDFGDGWRHVIAFEAFLQPEKNVQYPCCLSGERKCPPEDCGGVGGYGIFLEAIQDPDHEDHDRYLTWYGGEFDPDEFDPAQVQFDDPTERWRIAFIDP